MKQNFDLNEEQIEVIRVLNSKLVSLKNIIKELTPDDSDYVSDKLFNKVAEAQLAYDTWFTNIETSLNILTNQTQRWSVDFAAKKLILED